MKSETYEIWSKEEYNYSLSFGFIPTVTSYIHEDTDARNAVLVVPGGGYCIVSETEGEIVAKRFYDLGYNTFVLTYTTNILMKEPLKLQPLNDLSRGLRFIRKRAGEFHLNTDRIAVCGFSAGGHLSGSLVVHYADISDPSPEYSGISNRPDAAILSYPVLLSGEYTHEGSMQALLGNAASQEELQYMSLEKHVTSETPPCFLWHTVTDEAVPVENSLEFASACRKNHVEHELHLFSRGVHGLSLADEVWNSGAYGYPYTWKQLSCIREAIREGRLTGVGEEEKQMFESMVLDQVHDGVQNTGVFPSDRSPDTGIARWPMLADDWMKRLMISTE